MPDPPIPQKKWGFVLFMAAAMDWQNCGGKGRWDNMSEKQIIGIVAPSCPIAEGLEARVHALAAEEVGNALSLRFHPQCFLSDGHFAGTDQQRADAFVEMANDPEIDALWFARGGYGAARIAEAIIPRLNDAARAKHYYGYSDAGFLFAALYQARIGTPIHAPMPVDLGREGGDEAVRRSLRAMAGLDQPDDWAERHGDAPHVAFNLTVLCGLLGTPIEPDLSDHVLMIEDVGEVLYRIDRMLFHLTSQPGMARIAGISPGRMSDTENDRPFGQTIEEMFDFWCARGGMPLLSPSDIGHDNANKLVRFG